MQFNLTTILVLVVVLFIGYGIGLFEMNVRRKKKIEQLEKALREEAEKTPETPLYQPEPVRTNELHLWADLAGALKLEIDSMPIESPAVLTPEQRRRLVALLVQVRPLVEGGPVAPAPAAPAPVPPAAEARPPAAAAAKAAKAAKPAAQPAPPPIGSIVSQIDDVLQARLANTPMAAQRIRLAESGTGVRVFIGEQSYEGLDAVPDPEVVAAIRAAIAEWEKRVG